MYILESQSVPERTPELVKDLFFTPSQRRLYQYVFDRIDSGQGENIVLVSGPSGSGKTWLMRLLREMSQHKAGAENDRAGLGMALHDFAAPDHGEHRASDLFAILISLRNQLVRAGAVFSMFDLAVAVYLHKRGLLTPERIRALFPFDDRPFLAGIRDTLTAFTREAFAGEILNLLSATLGSRFTPYMMQRAINEEEIAALLRLRAEPELFDRLADYFLDDALATLRMPGHTSHFVLLFDALESFVPIDGVATPPAWLTRFITRLGGIDNATLLLAAQNEFAFALTENDPHVVQFNLDTPNRTLQSAFIKRDGAAMEGNWLTACENIISVADTEYTFHEVALLHDFSRNEKNAAAEEATSLVDDILGRKGLISLRQFLRLCDRDMTHALITLSAARTFTADLFMYLGKVFHFNDTEALFRRVTDLSFIHLTSGGPHKVFRMAPHAREQIRKYSRQIRKNAHRALEHYFNLYFSKTCELARVEAIYHLNQFHEEKGVQAWLSACYRALDRQEYRFCRALLALIPELRISTDFLRARVIAVQADFAARTGRHADAAQMITRALYHFEQAVEADAADLPAWNGLGLALIARARAVQKSGEPERASELVPRALVAFETALKRNALWLPALINKSSALTLMGEFFLAGGRTAEAENSFSAALRCAESALENAPAHATALRALVASLLRLCALQRDVHGPEVALNTLEKYSATALRAAAVSRARLFCLQGALQAESGDSIAALASFQRVCSDLKDSVTEHAGDFAARYLLARSSIEQVLLLRLLGREEEAEQMLEQAITAVEPVLWAYADDPEAQCLSALANGLRNELAAGDSAALLWDQLRYGEPHALASANYILARLETIDSLLRAGEIGQAQAGLEELELVAADCLRNSNRDLACRRAQGAFWLLKAECSLVTAEYTACRLALEMAEQTVQQMLEHHPFSQALNRLALRIAVVSLQAGNRQEKDTGAILSTFAGIMEHLTTVSPENSLARAEALLAIAECIGEREPEKALSSLEQALDSLAGCARWPGIALQVNWLSGRIWYRIALTAIARADYPRADEACVTALQLYNQCLEAEFGGHSLQNDKVLALSAYSDLLRLQSKFADAEEFARGALELAEALPESTAEFINSRALAHGALADCAVATARFDEAIDSLKKIDGAYKKALKKWPGHLQILENQLTLLLKTARLLLSLGKSSTAEQLLKRAETVLGKLTAAGVTGADMALFSAQLSQYQAELLMARKKDHPDIRTRLDAAIATLRQAIDKQPLPRLQIQLANALQAGAWQQPGADKDAVLADLRQAVEHYNAITERYPADLYAQYNTGLALAKLGFLQVETGDLEDAMFTFQDALTAYEAALQTMPGRSDLKQKKGDILLAAALLHISVGQREEAADSLTVAARAFEEALAAMPGNTHALYNRGIALLRLGDLQIGLDRKGQAIWSLRTSIECFDAVLANEPDQPAVLKNRAESSHALGDLQFSFSQYQDAADHFKEAVSTYDKVLDLSAGDFQSKARKARSLYRLGVVLDLLHEQAAAIRALGKAANLCNRLLREEQGTTAALQTHTDALRELARIYRTQEQHAEAEQAYQQAIRFLDFQLDNEGEAVELKLLIKGRTQSSLAEMKKEMSLLREASEIYRQSIETLNDAIAESPDFVPAYFEMGLAFAARAHLQKEIGDSETAMSDYGRAVSAFEEVISREAEHTGALFNKGTVLADLGRLQLELGLHNEAKFSLKSAYDQITHVLHVDQSEVAFHNARSEIKQLIARLDEMATN